MPRYFFHLVATNFIVPDHTLGRDLRDDSAARDCAVADIRTMMRDKPLRGLNPSTSSIEVTDERGKPFLEVPFHQAMRMNLRHAPPGGSAAKARRAK